MEEIVDKTNKQCLESIETEDADNVVHKKIKSFTDEQIEDIKDIVTWVTTSTVSNMFQFFEQNYDIKFLVDYNGEEINIADVSDGLDGDFLGEEGWIDRFGEHLDFVTEEGRKQMARIMAKESTYWN